MEGVSAAGSAGYDLASNGAAAAVAGVLAAAEAQMVSAASALFASLGIGTLVDTAG
jgi:hypothetical protein